MKKGNVNSAMKILTDNMKNGILPLTRQTLNQLQLKHTEETHRRIDADGWKRILTSKQFGKSSIDLYKAFAEAIKKIRSIENLSVSLEAFVACPLIPLDKNPGLRHIGIGEVLRRIDGKVVVTHFRTEIVTSVGSMQVCAGQEAGCELVIHAMHAIHEDETCEAVFLVDASNTFNSIHRNVILHNVTIICPAIAIYVKNYYSLSQHDFSS